METDIFHYNLPRDLIAQQPASRRDQSRMLVVCRSENSIKHKLFSDFPAFLNAGDLLVVNDTRVIPARVWGRKQRSGGIVEILFLEETEPGIWSALMHASRRPKIGARIILGDGKAEAEVLADGRKGETVLKITAQRPLRDLLEEIGVPPLPPYIKREKKRTDAQQVDRERYQTVYARDPGAVAAPTAGLHFTSEILDQLEKQGIHRAAITLHVGPGTFRPVDTDRVEDFQMEPERYEVPEPTVRAIEEAGQRGGRVVAVGSTTVRTLETVAAEHGKIIPAKGRTRLFIYPPFEFKVVDALLTNFHLPKSTLLMMICAFGGMDLIMQAYHEAVKERYRFYSYGDCMLII